MVDRRVNRTCIGVNSTVSMVNGITHYMGLRMNKVSWAIQTNFIAADQVESIWNAAKDCGCDTQEIIIIPFSKKFGNDKDIPDLGQYVIPYGSTSMMHKSKKMKWKGFFYDAKTFKVNIWNKKRDDMLNADAKIMKIKDTEAFLTGCDEDKMMFIRPLRDLKEFNGTLTNVGEIRRWMKSADAGSFNFSQETDVILASAKQIEMEYRFFIVDGKVIDGSLYRIHGQLFSQPVTDPLVMEEAQRMADKWLPSPCCVMDAALLKNDEKMYCIEFNTLNSSGFYYNNIPKIVKALTEYVSKL
jgi:ATP-grasp domain, R2K clade family 3